MDVSRAVQLLTVAIFAAAGCVPSAGLHAQELLRQDLAVPKPQNPALSSRPMALPAHELLERAAPPRATPTPSPTPAVSSPATPARARKASTPAPSAPAPVPAPSPIQSAAGLSYQVLYNAEGLADVSGGPRRGAVYDGLLVLSLTLDPGKLLKLQNWTGTTLFIKTFYPHGTSLSREYVHDLNGVSNIDAYDTFRLNECWIEQNVSGRFAVRAGMIAVDSEFFGADGTAPFTPADASAYSGSYFLNSCFGALPIVSLNFNAPIYPVAAPGIRLSFQPVPSVALRFAVTTGDVGSQDLDNKHGTRVSFHPDAGVLALAECVYKCTGDHPGTYTLGGFYHSGRFDDVDGRGGQHWNDGGIYGVADRSLWTKSAGSTAKGSMPAPAQSLNAFARAGVALPADRNPVSYYLEGGLTYLAPFSRSKDACGLACTYTRISDDFRDEVGAPPPTRHETVVEAFYQAGVTGWFSVEPDIQYIVNPGAVARTDNALVLGARATLKFGGP